MNASTSLSARAALLLIDLQKGIHEPKLGRRNNPDAEARVKTLLDSWRRSGRPVVHVRHISRSPDSVFWPGRSGVEFQEAFSPLDREHVVEKNVPDAFAATGLARWLHERGIAQLVIAGVITNNSVESTARAAGNLGFDAIVAGDACFTFDQRDLSGRLWPAEDVHALSLANLAMDYARVMTVADIVARAGG
ncbi:MULTISPECIES: cysteine hydrolase family protein [Burkholderia]|uniref:Cysteine hydrolase n=2 Tax=Burkholderia humptydooensis TaxID=430531 RepID=A0A7U4P9Y9_9BURK|nr:MULTISPECIES: cysteine hydrolase family protein [Burkholderia]AJY38743.1 isochorismatase family protein [Burkholderia sp. 2002721687]ALX45657.1 isochorismatase [Burkholderia humptydooensis]EIP86615.1 isochorismatase family protein [Burkholderia humptydooensis MSMB43]KVN17121.1 isochorismatase [Burkholderia sp. MSMB1552]KWZ50862.1 isochorismatase [Burkholderia sp. MSMB1588]